MPISIATNITSQRAQRMLGRNVDQAQAVYERLSSGVRINRPSDDAASLAVADSLRVDARLFAAASRNINDGISLLTIMGGALSEQKQILFRLSEIAEQSANGVYTERQRAALSAEYETLVAEMGRIGRVPTFNDQSLLQAGRGPSPDTVVLQAGINGRAESLLTVTGVDTAPFSGTVTVRDDVTDTSGDPPFQGSPDGSVTVDDQIYAQQVAQANNVTFDQLAEYAGNNVFNLTVTDSGGAARELIGILTFGDYTAGDGRVSLALYEKDAATGLYSDVGRLEDQSAAERGAQPLQANLTFADGATGAAVLDLRGLTVHTDNSGQYTQTAIEFTGVETVGRARHALERLAHRLDELGQIEGQIGALQSRLETAAQTVSTARVASADAESRIRDTDVAGDSAELLRLQILQRASLGVLAQANQQPEIALQLLR